MVWMCRNQLLGSTSEILDACYAAFILSSDISFANMKKFIKTSTLNPCLSSLIYIYNIYIYIERERDKERERDRQTGRQGTREKDYVHLAMGKVRENDERAYFIVPIFQACLGLLISIRNFYFYLDSSDNFIWKYNLCNYVTCHLSNRTYIYIYIYSTIWWRLKLG